MNKNHNLYPEVNPKPKFPEIEEKILQYWKDRDIFKKSVEKNPAGERGENEYVFYDGPPFANGLPHYGHLLTGYVKDIIPRYQTMLGKRVERRFGWDCHGLPAEMEAEKELGVSGRKQIEEYGIDKFNEYCRSSVMRYTKEWERYVTRQARWVDFENDYKTMDLPYMESVMWAFKRLYELGLIYEGYRVLPYSWACQTPLSNFEIKLDNSYRPRIDPSVTVLFELLEPLDGKKAYLLIWTTTPWTLISNLLIAVNKEIEYAIYEENERRYIIAKAVAKDYEKELKGAKLVGVIKGEQLIGKEYKPIYPYFKGHKNAFRVVHADFVAVEEGTGIVHLAPFGEDDAVICERENVELVCPVDEGGRFTDEIKDFAGLLVFDANKKIIKDLKERGLLVRHRDYKHNYPHCWRTDTPVIYMPMSSWYVKVTEFKDRMVKLNKNINWIPEHVKEGQFGRWLENARDWSISRNRFWGSPIPVWKSDSDEYPRIDVYGSLEELERDFGVKPKDLHRPYIDELTRPNPDDPSGKSIMRRVPHVLDCWFESGSMPFAQVHYPFESKEWFEQHFPADFIVEYIAQTRGWFYTLMVLATALFDSHPFKNAICHGVVLDVNGQKLSKRLRNYPDPDFVFNEYGSDALRWFLCSSAILKGQNLQIDKEGKAIAESTREALHPIWNAYYFFTLYANSDGIKGEFALDSEALLDRYILSKTRAYVERFKQHMDRYEISEACHETATFLDALNNWFIRRSRERFWKHEKDQDKQWAYNTLYVVLTTLCKTCAPLLPLIVEEIYMGLTGKESVHLEDFPDVSTFPNDAELVRKMDLIRDICSAALSIRDSHRLRTRLPLSRIIIAGLDVDSLSQYESIIKDEINVKEVRLCSSADEYAVPVLEVNARKIGPRLGAKTQDVIRAAKEGKWTREEEGRVVVNGETLEEGEYTIALKPKEGLAAERIRSGDIVVVLDINVTEELRREGLARDLIRFIQQARKEDGLHVSDHIRIKVEGNQRLKEVLERHRDFIARETLADDIQFCENLGDEGAHSFKFEDVKGKLMIRKNDQ